MIVAILSDDILKIVSYLQLVQVLVENKQYMMGLAALFNGEKLWINTAIATCETQK